MAIWVIYAILAGAEEAEPPFSRLSEEPVVDRGAESHPQHGDFGQEDYFDWSPSPYFAGGEPGPIPHPAEDAVRT